MNNGDALFRISSGIEFVVNELENGSIGTVESEKLQSLHHRTNYSMQYLDICL